MSSRFRSCCSKASTFCRSLSSMAFQRLIRVLFRHALSLYNVMGRIVTDNNVNTNKVCALFGAPKGQATCFRCSQEFHDGISENIGVFSSACQS